MPYPPQRGKEEVKSLVPFFVFAFLLAEAVKSGVRTARSANRMRLTRQISCYDDFEYPTVNHCCQRCEAGQYVKKACERAGEKGICEPCPSDTYTEHRNGLDRCLQCTKCHEDKVATQACTSTKNTECQCKTGSFCEKEQACEVCKKCKKCKDGEEVMTNCTITSNTKCRPKPPSPASSHASQVAIPVVFVLLLLIALAIVWYCCCWKKKATESHSGSGEDVEITVEEDDKLTVERQNRQNAGLEEPGQELEPFLPHVMLVGPKPSPGEDDDNGLGDSLPNTTTSSQSSLSTPPVAPQPSPKTPRQPAAREDGSCRRLIPVNGEDSLMKSFDIIEKNLDCNLRNKFFRRIGLSDNDINDPILSSHGDRVYKLLKLWMEKQGLKADINDLIHTLLELHQKLSAETVIQEVIERGFYTFEDESG
ncbi:tumor necrosis factor receptor superfamily member 10B-like isoform X2 [Conger conger]|uniref:tumor necrosis factor receptor superfamily member 10B-like isoform X2 n=1 Tax=Conger conger TaxID=82655 RepID=UPI002A5B0AC5|nr:tumor necrosis factor receptor superfamily member 10B-like isoform X2 [Conger conger]